MDRRMSAEVSAVVADWLPLVLALFFLGLIFLKIESKQLSSLDFLRKDWYRRKLLGFLLERKPPIAQNYPLQTLAWPYFE